MGILYIVATPIGNLGDISKRSLDILHNVDLILCEDTRTSSHLLNFYNIQNKLQSYHKFNEEKKTKEIINLLKKGQNIALISDAGTPCISDPGSVLVYNAIKNNIEVYSIPGPSAVITSLTLSGINLNNFGFYGFLERKKNLQIKQLLKIKKNDLETIVIYESPKRIIETIKNIQYILENPYLVVLNDLTKKFEKKYYGLADEILSELTNNPNYELGEYVLIIKKNQYSCNEKLDNISIESLLIDVIVKEKCTIKDAINKLSSSSNYKKNELYKASLNLKKLFEK